MSGSDEGPDGARGVDVAAVDRILSKLDELSGAVADLRVSVARLEERVDQRPSGRSKSSGGGGGGGKSVAAGGLLGAALGGLISHFTSR